MNKASRKKIHHSHKKKTSLPSSKHKKAKGASAKKRASLPHAPTPTPSKPLKSRELIPSFESALYLDIDFPHASSHWYRNLHPQKTPPPTQPPSPQTNPRTQLITFILTFYLLCLIFN